MAKKLKEREEEFKLEKDELELRLTAFKSNEGDKSGLLKDLETKLVKSSNEKKELETLVAELKGNLTQKVKDSEDSLAKVTAEKDAALKEQLAEAMQKKQALEKDLEEARERLKISEEKLECFVNGHLVFKEGVFYEDVKGQRLLFNR